MTSHADTPEAQATDLSMLLRWRLQNDGSLSGMLVATNNADRRVRITGKPRLIALGVDGRELDADMIVSADLRIPDFVELGPGEQAQAAVSWAGWDGPASSGQVVVELPGGRVQATVLGPPQPNTRGPATNLSSSWFSRPN